MQGREGRGRVRKQRRASLELMAGREQRNRARLK